MKQEHGDTNAVDRRSRILDLLSSEGELRVADLSRRFGVSEVTIRSDLGDLEEQGLLQRVHGGAMRSSRSYHSMPVQERLRVNEAEKRAIARAVAARIDDRDTVMLNSGTTTLLLAQELKRKHDLTIVTNSLAVAQELGDNTHQVILIGGAFDARYQFTYGDDAIRQLAAYKADKLVLAVDGVSAQEGITTYLPFEAQTDRQMIQRARHVVVAADYAKIGRVSFAAIEPVSAVSTLVTDAKADEREIAALRKRGVEVQIVKHA